MTPSDDLVRQLLGLAAKGHESDPYVQTLRHSADRIKQLEAGLYETQTALKKAGEELLAINALRIKAEAQLAARAEPQPVANELLTKEEIEWLRKNLTIPGAIGAQADALPYEVAELRRLATASLGRQPSAYIWHYHNGAKSLRWEPGQSDWESDDMPDCVEALYTPAAPPARALGGEPEGYLVQYYEESLGDDKKRCTTCSLEPREPTIMLPFDERVAKRELISAQPLYLTSSGYALGFQEAREAAAKACDAQANLRYMSSGIGHVTDAAIGMASQLAVEIRALEKP